MSLTSRCFLTRSAAILAAVASCAASAQAASMTHPNVGPVPPGITYSGIVESSGTDAVPLYGAGSGNPLGISFTPTPGFVSSSTGGGADITDGQINFTITTGPGAGGIPLLSVLESGAYSITGA